MARIAQVTNADGKGWLMVKHDSPKDPKHPTFPPLPQHLKVSVNKVENGREYFRILEGHLSGTTASVKLAEGNKSYLSDLTPHTGPAYVSFNRKKNELRYGWFCMHTGWPWICGTIKAITDKSSPVPIGTWNLEIPYEVHGIGSGYESSSSFAATWFRIASESKDSVSDRFLHPGNVTLGCVTVKTLSSWTNIYNYLIKSRKGDGKNVGTIEVFEEE